MAKTFSTILRLAGKDYWHEFLLSACAVLGLAAVLTPLMVLYGVKFGVVQTLTERLRNDPRNLEISPVVSGRYTPEYLAQLAAHPDVAFVLPRTRSIAATMDLSVNEARPETNTEANGRILLVASLEPTAAGDPLLLRFGAAAPLMPQNPAAEAIGVTLSAPAAEKLHVKQGDTLNGKVERRFQGKVQTARVALRVAAVLPLAAQQKDVAYVPLPLMEATEDYRDGRAVPELGAQNGWTGEPRPQEPRVYPGFRLYARNLEDVMPLRHAFATQKLDVYTRAEEIEQVTALARALNMIFALICAATAIGFLASTASSVLASIKRKQRILGLLRLNGFTTGRLVLFPLTQSLLTALLGTALAAGVYGVAALVINTLFRASVSGLEQVCLLLPQHFLITFAAVAGLALLAALGPALRAARIEPSEVIREI
ncbi:MAG: FtsX-like permease family protein [Desulfovibrio sp.]|uniref:FtsX-like permease family protein n=1 Tax=Desulfovibrio sp. TaxID=885 RepID=UPI00135ECA10|nr:FtsX-like permease family protein [Desulfovibrio sp.]MTJ92673.1 FtsX-like permease family protein [Desulfovibrio sp.]